MIADVLTAETAGRILQLTTGTEREDEAGGLQRAIEAELARFEEKLMRDLAWRETDQGEWPADRQECY